ncbi:MAG: hypothetical protein B7X55_11550 [Rhodobacterales bacterium 34-62-10]|nr:MAG: hypothetical protein B7X55_11550 [Rhodobacterales bacterium 34-62-10]
MAIAAALTRPELTLPEAEAETLVSAYAMAHTILEYGSGGSTVMAAELGKRVTSVESDKGWAQMMRDWFAAHPPVGQVDILWSDIGPTKEWGHPVDDSAWKGFARYPLAVWDMPGFTHPDVVLVDGRFRMGCALATAFRISRPVTLYYDDYTNRPRHHQIETFLGAPTEITGRMARFDINPMPVPAERLLQVFSLMTRP